MRRRIRRFDIDRRNGCTIASLDANEKITAAYYLYQITRNIPNEELSEDSTVLTFFQNLIHASNKKEKFSKILHHYIQNAEKKHLLKKLPEEQINEDSDSDQEQQSYSTRQDNSYTTETFSFPYYDADIEIRRQYDIDESAPDSINLYRCLESENIGTVSRLVALTFFIKNPECAIEKGTFTIPRHFKDIAMDTKPVNFLQQELSLSKLECLYILIRYRKATIEKLDYIISEYSTSAQNFYSTLLDSSIKEINYILRPDQKLLQYGFFDSDHDMSQALIDCIKNQDFNLYFSDLVKTLDTPTTYRLDEFSVPQDIQKIMRQVISGDSPVSLLLYGKPGSGKTEFSKSLIKSCGKKIILFKNEAEILNKEEVLSRLNCFLSLKQEDSVLIVDEADTLLKTTCNSFFSYETSSTSKGVVNKMLDQSNNKVIWIVNRVNQIEDSTRRRFTFSYKFETMSSELLRTIAQTKLQQTKLSGNARQQILEMLGLYNITGASVDNIVKTINSFTSSEQNYNEQELIRNTEIVLRENSLLLNGNPKMREQVGDYYDVSILNTNVSAKKIIDMIKNAQKFDKKNNLNSRQNGIRMLFYGLSGTGKTEFARYIGQKIEKKILLKRASDILNKYVGENEQNIKDAFEEAATNNQILLFDEADTFFANRNLANSGWERTMVNEFLTQMEEFPGILICTTNLRSIMDPALLRRFHITTEFKALTREGISQLLKKYFSAYTFTDSQIENLCSFESVTPGDFGRLSDRIRFMNEEDISSQVIIDELINNQKEKMEDNRLSSSRKIGFAS